MSYAAAIDQLNALAPELHSQPGVPRRKFSLEEIGVLLERLGNPHHRFKSLLIAGTNGKGSTAATLASILRASGIRTGLYTSPHLERPNERIRVDGAEIADGDFSRHFFAVKSAGEELVGSGALAQRPSFFETVTAMAFCHFAEQSVEIAVLEVGMGGRLDATNIVDPLLSIITDISLDHTEWLGPTIRAIAIEKAGILRPNGILVTLPQHPEANQALGEVATELHVRGVSATPYVPSIGTPGYQPYSVQVMGETIEVASPLSGLHQRRNVALAIAAAAELARHYDLPINAESIARGVSETQWPGRLEVLLLEGITWILDVAHNPAGAWALRAGLRDLLEPEVRGEKAAGSAAKASGRKVLVFSCLRDKPVAEMLQILLPVFDQVYFAPIANPRAASLPDLMQVSRATGAHAEAKESISAALDAAVEAAGRGSVVVSGSVYLVGDVRRLLRERSGRSQS